MKSKAAIGNHPIHPLLVPVPIGAFFLVLVGDVAHLLTADPFWYRFSTVAINLGLAFALFAAAVGAVDYLGLRLNRRANAIATAHALTNVAVVALYSFSDVLRMGGAGLRSDAVVDGGDLFHGELRPARRRGMARRKARLRGTGGSGRGVGSSAKHRRPTPPAHLWRACAEARPFPVAPRTALCSARAHETRLRLPHGARHRRRRDPLAGAHRRDLSERPQAHRRRSVDHPHPGRPHRGGSRHGGSPENRSGAAEFSAHRPAAVPRALRGRPRLHFGPARRAPASRRRQPYAARAGRRTRTADRGAGRVDAREHRAPNARGPRSGGRSRRRRVLDIPDERHPGRRRRAESAGRGPAPGPACEHPTHSPNDARVARDWRPAPSAFPGNDLGADPARPPEARSGRGRGPPERGRVADDAPQHRRRRPGHGRRGARRVSEPRRRASDGLAAGGSPRPRRGGGLPDHRRKDARSRGRTWCIGSSPKAASSRSPTT